MIAARRPRFASGLAGRRDRIRLPKLLAGLGIERGKEAAHAHLPARGAQQHLAIDDERRQRHVVALLVVVDFRGPDLLAGLGVERHQHRLCRGEKDLVAIKTDAAIGRMQRNHVFGERALVTPQHFAGLGFEREQLVAGRRREHHAVVHDRRRLMAFDLSGGEAPDRLQAAHILRRDVRERAVTPTIVGAAEHQPVAVLRLFQPLGGDRRIFLQDVRHRSRRRRGRGRCDHLLRRSMRDSSCCEHGGDTHASHENLGHCHDVSSCSFSFSPSTMHRVGSASMPDWR